MLEVKTQYCPASDNTICKKDFFEIKSSCDKNELEDEPNQFYYKQNGILKKYEKSKNILSDDITKLVYIGDSSGPSVNKIFDIFKILLKKINKHINYTSFSLLLYLLYYANRNNNQRNNWCVTI
jgi:hypothetical protein